MKSKAHAVLACKTGSRRVGGAVVIAAIALVWAHTAEWVQGAEVAALPAWRSLGLSTDGKVDPAWTQVGWGGFVAEEGMLRTAPDPRGLGLLVYARERLGNCQLRVVFKAKEVKSNAGIYVRLTDGILS